MKKLLILVVLVVVGAGVYVAFFNKELKTEITEKVSQLVASSDFHSLDSYESSFTKGKEISFVEEKEGYVGGFSESLQMRYYQDSEKGSLLLACQAGNVQVFKATFTAEDSAIGQYSRSEIQRMFDVPVDFTQTGDAESEFAELNWYQKDSEVTVVINKKELAKVSAVSKLSEEQQEQLDKLKEIITLKLKMQAEWDKLQDQKHFALDQDKFKQIADRMVELKSQAETLSVNAKKIIKNLPLEQVVALKDKMEGGL